MDSVTLYVCYVCETISNINGECANCGEKLAPRLYVAIDEAAQQSVQRTADNVATCPHGVQVGSPCHFCGDL